MQRLFAPLVNQPVDTSKIEALLDQVRSDGAFDADYTVGYESMHGSSRSSSPPRLCRGTIDVAAMSHQRPPRPPPGTPPAPEPGAPIPKVGREAKPGEDVINAQPGAPGFAATQEATPQSLAQISSRPIILVNVTRRKTGPPFVVVGANVEAQTNGFTRATIEGVVLDQDFGGYGSELRSKVAVGYLTELGSEYFRPLNPLAAREHTYFVAPRIDFLREPFPIFTGANQVADRQLQHFDLGADVGLDQPAHAATARPRSTTGRNSTGTSPPAPTACPNFSGQSQRASLKYDFDTQDRALVPQFGVHLSTEAAYLFSTVNSENSPELSGRFSIARRFSLHKAPPKDAPRDPERGHEVFVFATEGGTMFHHDVAQPFRFTLGGPLRLSASAIDQYRGTDYWLVEPAILRRVANLPRPLGQSIYLGIGAEAGQIRAPGMPVISRQDAYFGVVAETPLGVITLAPAIGSNGERKFVFTLGKLF